MKKLVIVLMFVTAVVGAQYSLDKIKPSYLEVPPLLLPAQAVKIADLGLNSATAGLIWVRAVQNSFILGSKNQFLLPDYLNSVNNLDPRFSYPYAFATLIMPALQYVDEGIKIGERGLRDADPDWRIPYYLATTYHIYKHDRINAAKYLDIASRMVGVPDSVKKMAINYGTSPDVREQTRQIWISIYETSNDEIIRERAKLYILHYEYMALLEKAAVKYRQRLGSYPNNLNQLVTAGILKEIPKDPFGFDYVIDGRGRVDIKTN